MLFELKIGKLIRQLNPYTNGAVDTMHCGASPPVISPALAHALTTIAADLTTYANNPTPQNLQPVEQDEGPVDLNFDISDIGVRVDNDHNQDYMTWMFRAQPYAVRKALRVTYRYELTDKQGAGTGVFATEHVLIGYAGGNGGG
jgi:hypothetical protein